MAEYIEKQEVLYILKSLNTAHLKLKGKPMLGFISATDLIQDIPPSDVEPVNHGHWEEKIVESEDDPCGLFRRRWYCSSCGDWQTYGTDYCPMCGAYMRGENDG